MTRSSAEAPLAEPLKLAIWGASGHGRVVCDAVERANHMSVVGFLDDDLAKKGSTFASYPVLGGKEALLELGALGVSHVHVAVGHCAHRRRIADELCAAGFELATVIHPNSTIAADVEIAPGTFVAAGVVVNPKARIGRNVILNTLCGVDHETVIGDSVHIAPGARIGGLVRIDAETFIGIGATVLNCRSIGANTLVGAGAVVVKDLPGGIVAFGVPARHMRLKEANE